MTRFINSASIKSFNQNITVSGTPEQLTAYPVPDGVSVLVKAKRTNTGSIMLGGTSAEALNTNANFSLAAGQAASYQVQNTDDIWFDGTVSGEGVEVTLEF